MRRTSLVSLLALTASLGWAGEPAATAAEGRGVAAATASRRTASPETIAKLAATTPKFDPALQSKPVEPPVDLREVDKPRNTIIRLPAFVIQDKKAAITPTKREVQTAKERREVVLNRYPGLKLGNFFGLNEGLAYFMMYEEERLEKKREAEDMLTLLRFGDPAAEAKAKQEVKGIFLRAPDFGR